MKKLLIAMLGFVFVCGVVKADEVLLGHVKYQRTDVTAKTQSIGIWTFTQNNKKGEVNILKTVPGATFEIESISEWGRTSTLILGDKRIGMKESFVRSLGAIATGEVVTNIGHVEATDMETGEVLDRWPTLCTVLENEPFYMLSCKTFMSDGGAYEVTREFVKGRTMFVPRREQRKITSADGSVVSHVVDAISP